MANNEHRWMENTKSTILSHNIRELEITYSSDATIICTLRSIEENSEWDLIYELRSSGNEVDICANDAVDDASASLLLEVSNPNYIDKRDKFVNELTC